MRRLGGGEVGGKLIKGGGGLKRHTHDMAVEVPRMRPAYNKYESS